MGIRGSKLIFFYSNGEKSREWPGKDKIYWSGVSSIWREDKLTKADTVYLTEGETDAISLLDAGLETSNTVVVAAPSATTFREEWTAKFHGKKVILCFDNDPAGKAGQEKAAKILQSRAKSIDYVDLSLHSNVKDVTALFESTAPTEFIMAIGRCTRDNASPEVTESAKSLQSESSESPSFHLPEIVSLGNFLENNIPEPKELITGLLHQGSKMVLAGGSKSYKTWSLLDLGISVATGTKWWDLDTEQSRVLYINFEIQGSFIQKRLNQILAVKEINRRIDDFDIWNLRGNAADLSVLRPALAKKASEGNYGLIIIDPIYKGLGNRDENSASSIGTLLNEIEKLAVETGAAVVFGAHFSKGNQAGKESIDRIAGSGVFARDPDSILIMTAHEKQDAFTVEPCLRNFPRMDPFCVTWEWPLMKRDSDLNPRKLKQAGNRQQMYSGKDLLDALGDKTLSVSDWMSQVTEATEMCESTFRNNKKDLENAGKIKMEGRHRWRKTTADEEKSILEKAGSDKPDKRTVGKPSSSPPSLSKEIRDKLATEAKSSGAQHPPLT